MRILIWCVPGKVKKMDHDQNQVTIGQRVYGLTGAGGEVARVLVIDDEAEAREALRSRLRQEAYEVRVVGSQREGIGAIAGANEPFDVVVTDNSTKTPEGGIEIIKAAAERDVFTEVIVLVAHENVPNAVECIRRGAFDYVEKNIPGVDVHELLMIKIERALERREEAYSSLTALQRMARDVSLVRQAAQGRAKASHYSPEPGPVAQSSFATLAKAIRPQRVHDRRTRQIPSVVSF